MLTRNNLLSELNYARDFERTHLPFIKTIEDSDIIKVIGASQAIGKAITLKDIIALRICAVATLERRISRLKNLSIISSVRSKADKRLVELQLSNKTLTLYKKYATEMQKFRETQTT